MSLSELFESSFPYPTDLPCLLPAKFGGNLATNLLFTSSRPRSKKGRLLISQGVEAKHPQPSGQRHFNPGRKPRFPSPALWISPISTSRNRWQVSENLGLRPGKWMQEATQPPSLKKRHPLSLGITPGAAPGGLPKRGFGKPRDAAMDRNPKAAGYPSEHLTKYSRRFGSIPPGFPPPAASGSAGLSVRKWRSWREVRG